MWFSAKHYKPHARCPLRVKLRSRVGRHRLPLSPSKQTSSGRSGKSVSCQTQTWRIESRKRKSRPKAAPNSQLPISKLGGHQQRGSLQLEELLQEGLNVLMGFVRRRFLVVAARKPFFIARIAW